MFKLVAFIVFGWIFLSSARNSDHTSSTPVISYETFSLRNNLWAYFPFSGGSFGDSSGNKRNLRGVNGIKFGADKSGMENNALLFDGVNDYAVIDSGKNFPAGDFSVSFWMKPLKTVGGRIFNKANFINAQGSCINCGFDDDNANGKLTFSISNNSNICNSLWAPGTASDLYPGKVIPVNAWHFIVAEHSGGVLKLYLNGQLISSDKSQRQSFVPCSNAPIYFGIWWLKDLRAYKGTLDNIRIYTKALTAREIQYLYKNSL